MMGYYGSNGWQGWMVVMMWIWPLLVGLSAWALVAVTRDHHAGEDKDDPADILKRRFARGEMTQEDYLEAVATLENGSSRPVHG